MRVVFVVKVISVEKNPNDEYNIIGGYYMERDIPFLPTKDMKFEHGTSTWLWETKDGFVLSPSVKEIVYDINEKKVFCLFETNKHLISTYWNKIKDINNSFELNQFKQKNKYLTR